MQKLQESLSKEGEGISDEIAKLNEEKTTLSDENF